jgi:DNA-binding LacI/PurR family transcriptional regulator
MTAVAPLRWLCQDVIDYGKAGMVANIKQVAERAQVSSATVSRVLNHDARVSESARERVLKATAELDYRPNRIARSLRRQATETIGVVVSDIENPHFTRAVRAIEDAAYKRGYRVILCNTDETPEKQRAYLQVLAAEQVVGVIIAPADPTDPTISSLIDMNIPVVAFDRSVDDQRADAVFADNVQVARRATEHLIQSGCQHVGFIAGRREIQTGAERLHGYEDAMNEHGLPLAVGDGEFRLDTAQEATKRLLANTPALDGLVVANNLMAIGALRALRESGKTVPDNIAFVGIDDPPWAGLVDPPMTTFGQPIQEMARLSFEMLLERIEKKRTHARFVIFNFEPHFRASSIPGVAERTPSRVPSAAR